MISPPDIKASIFEGSRGWILFLFLYILPFSYLSFSQVFPITHSVSDLTLKLQTNKNTAEARRKCNATSDSDNKNSHENSKLRRNIEHTKNSFFALVLFWAQKRANVLHLWTSVRLLCSQVNIEIYYLFFWWD